jgi:hypothetical protein
MKTLFDEPWYHQGKCKWRLIKMEKGAVEYEAMSPIVKTRGQCTIGEWNDHIKNCEARYEDAV